MKEREFEFVPGFEEINTPVQLDTFEASNAKALFNRYIFDLKTNLSFDESIYAPPYDQDDQDPNSSLYKYTYYWKNNTFYDTKFSGLGIPGELELIYKNFTGISSTSNRVDPVISYVDEIPSWDKNAMLYVGSKFLSAYGSGAGGDAVKAFRSGYFEFTIKTNNQNCTIGYGSAKVSSYGTFGVLPNAEASSSFGSVPSNEPAFIDSQTAVREEPYSNLKEFSVEIINGKLAIRYKDEYGTDRNNFLISSKAVIADNNWHHVVINIGKPGIIRSNRKKSNKRFIEIWVDGELDIVDFDVINKKQVFFPQIEWLLGNPNFTFATDNPSWNSYDLEGSTQFVGNTEIQNVTRGIFNPIGDKYLFSGQLQHWIMGMNTGLSANEISIRYALYINDRYQPLETMNSNAKIVTPTVQTNKKKALKLWWTDTEKINGVELDDNYVVESYSVTNQILNSPTEVFNEKLSNDTPINLLNNVKAVFEDHVNIFGPGKVWGSSLGQKAQLGFGGLDFQADLNSYSFFDSLSFPNWGIDGGYENTDSYDPDFVDAAIQDMPFSGINLSVGDRILLTNQTRVRENGVYIFNGYAQNLTRDSNITVTNLQNAVVYVEDGYHKDSYWSLQNNVSSVGEPQIWIKLENTPEQLKVNSQPLYGPRWSNDKGESRLIDINNDLDLSKYDLITFANYPEESNDIEEYFVDKTNVEINEIYGKFVESLKLAAANGASIMINSPKLAEDMGIVKKFTKVPQVFRDSDTVSANQDPFAISELPERYFHTHRNNRYHVSTPIPGLTDKDTYIMTDKITYIPEDQYDESEWHIKYTRRQFGLQENDEFLIPTFATIPEASRTDIPGYRQNYRGVNDFYAVAPSDVLAGTVVTQLENIYCESGNLCTNPYDDYATTIVVHDNQLLGNYQIAGKIFVNCVEDAYATSREDYNRGIIQIIPNDDPFETINTRLWQYSTTRLDKQDVRTARELKEYGQVVPTYDGGGPIVQSQTASSLGIIKDVDDSKYTSDLYKPNSEERYLTQEIAVFSMVWLGLKWLES